MRQNPEGFQFPSVPFSLTEPLPCTWIHVTPAELESRDPQGDTAARMRLRPWPGLQTKGRLRVLAGESGRASWRRYYSSSTL